MATTSAPRAVERSLADRVRQLEGVVALQGRELAALRRAVAAVPRRSSRVSATLVERFITTLVDVMTDAHARQLTFTVHDVQAYAQRDPRLHALVGDWNARRIGQLLRRASGCCCDGVAIQRVTRSAPAMVYEVTHQPQP